MDLDISNYELCQIKYQRFTLSGCKDKEVRKCEFVAKTQFLIPVDPPPLPACARSVQIKCLYKSTRTDQDREIYNRVS